MYVYQYTAVLSKRTQKKYFEFTFNVFTPMPNKLNKIYNVPKYQRSKCVNKKLAQGQIYNIFLKMIIHTHFCERQT